MHFTQIYSSVVIIEPDPGFATIPVVIDAALGNETVITVTWAESHSISIVLTGPDGTRVDHTDSRYNIDMDNKIVTINLPLAQVKPLKIILLVEKTAPLPFFVYRLLRLMVYLQRFWKPSNEVRLFTIFFQRCAGKCLSKVSSPKCVGFIQFCLIFSLIVIFFVLARTKPRVKLLNEQH